MKAGMQGPPPVLLGCAISMTTSCLCIDACIEHPFDLHDDGLGFGDVGLLLGYGRQYPRGDCSESVPPFVLSIGAGR